VLLLQSGRLIESLSNTFGSRDQCLDIPKAVWLYASPVEQIIVHEVGCTESHLLARFMDMETNCISDLPEQFVPCIVHMCSPILFLNACYVMKDLKFSSKSSGQNVFIGVTGQHQCLEIMI
jgi:hypothetical protein